MEQELQHQCNDGSELELNQGPVEHDSSEGYQRLNASDQLVEVQKDLNQSNPCWHRQKRSVFDLCCDQSTSTQEWRQQRNTVVIESSQ